MSGTLSISRKEMENLIKKNGGDISSSVTKTTTHLITTNQEYESETIKVAKAKKDGIPCY
jgi:poly [ADP-ribose] polymerase